MPKEGRKKRHELRFSLPGGEALVLAVQSREQAQRWLKVRLTARGRGGRGRTTTERGLEPFLCCCCGQVVQDVGSQCGSADGADGSTSPIIQRKLELDKVRSRLRSLRDFLE